MQKALLHPAASNCPCQGARIVLPFLNASGLQKGFADTCPLATILALPWWLSIVGLHTCPGGRAGDGDCHPSALLLELGTLVPLSPGTPGSNAKPLVPTEASALPMQ